MAKTALKSATFANGDHVVHALTGRHGTIMGNATENGLDKFVVRWKNGQMSNICDVDLRRP